MGVIQGAYDAKAEGFAPGGLGRYIVDGLALQEYERLFTGALLVALLAIGTELSFGVLERSSRHTLAVGREP